MGSLPVTPSPSARVRPRRRSRSPGWVTGPLRAASCRSRRSRTRTRRGVRGRRGHDDPDQDARRPVRRGVRGRHDGLDRARAVLGRRRHRQGDRRQARLHVRGRQRQPVGGHRPAADRLGPDRPARRLHRHPAQLRRRPLEPRRRADPGRLLGREHPHPDRPGQPRQGRRRFDFRGLARAGQRAEVDLGLSQGVQGPPRLRPDHAAARARRASGRRAPARRRSSLPASARRCARTIGRR